MAIGVYKHIIQPRWKVCLGGRQRVVLWVISSLICAVCVTGASADGPTGYAAMDGSGSQYLAGGTTGGAGGTVVTVDNFTDFSYYVGQTAPYIIQVRGAIIAPAKGKTTVKSNKTIIGLGNDAAIVGHGLSMGSSSGSASNIIIKNLTIKNNYMMGDWPGKQNDWDAIALRNTHHVWIDHCHLSRAGDGLCDMSYASGYVTISNTVFSHHNKVSISDGEDSPFTPAHYTYDHCWFFNTTQRNVTSSYAYVHAFNCYHYGIQSYCMNARTSTNMLLENIYFKQSDDCCVEDSDGLIQANGCTRDNCTGVYEHSGTSYTPPYSYELDSTSEVPAIVMANAGPGGYANTATDPVIFINFRPTSGDGVYGYLADYGYAYGDRGNGYFYGWDASNTGNAYWRKCVSTKDGYSLVPVDADFRRNAIITTGDGARYWEIGLDNGLYYVHLMCGDPGDPNGDFPANNVYRNNTMNVEGVTLTDPDGALLWDYDEYYVDVNVTDGKLTISQDTGGDDSALCFVDIHPATEAENPSWLVNGLDYKYYEGTWSFVPNFDSLTPLDDGSVANFDINDALSADGFGFVFEGYLDVPSDGRYTFYTDSNDGSKLFIGSTEVVDNDGTHGMQEASGEILLNAGKHAIRVDMFDRNGSEGLEVRWEGPGISKQLIPDGRLYRVLYGDFAGDGAVDMNDLGDFMGYWLNDNCGETVGLDLDDNCLINFREYSELAKNWGDD